VWACADTDSKRESAAVWAVSLVSQTAVLVMTATTNHVPIQLVTLVRTGQAGTNGHNVQPHAVLVREENKELATEKIFQKDTIAKDQTIFRNHA